jgi:replicative DNA helicase
MGELPATRRLWSVEAEQAVLGAMFLSPVGAAGDAISAGLTASHFFDQSHRTLWEHVAALAERGSPLDVITLSEHLEAADQLEQVGGNAYLVELTNNTPSSANLMAYVEIVKAKAFQRHYHDLLRRACEGFLDPAERDPVARADQLLAGLEASHSGGEFVPIAEAAKAYVDVLDQRHKNPGLQGLSSGYSCIDYRTKGYNAGDLIVIAARPGMGKTNYVLNILRHVGMQKQLGCALGFSLEMDNSQLIERLLAAQGRIRLGLLKSGEVFTHEDSIARLAPAMSVVRDLDVLLCDSPSMTVQEICAMSRREARRKKPSMVFVDYLGLVDYSGDESRHDLKIAEITRSLKKLGREIGCPVFLLAQLSRRVEERKDKRPMLSDLKDSGAIEADADIVQFLYRDDYYNDDSKWPDQVEVITAKGRGCEVGTDYLTWRGQYALMESNSDKDVPVSGNDGYH